MAQPGSAPGWGPGGRRFKSSRPDEGMSVSPDIARRLRWVPNALTIGRLIALPVLVWMLTRVHGTTDAVVAWTFAAVAITDLIDGFLARLLGAETAFGRLADPFADRMLVAVGLIGLIAIDRLPPVGPLIVFGRDVIVVGAVIALRHSGLDVRVNLLGKLSSLLVMASISLALLSTAQWIDVLFWGAVVLSIVTFVQYAWTAIVAARGRGISTHT